MSERPRVLLVVVNYNGEKMVRRCLEHLVATDWPQAALEILVVDNASTDGSPEEVARDFPQVRVFRSPANLGFSGGSNIGLRRRDGFDHVALVNSDAFVEPGWLAPLVEALEGDPTVGAANAKLVFEPRFVEVRLTTDPFVPSTADTRSLGVRVNGMRVDGADAWKQRAFVEGFYHPEWEAGSEFRWSSATGTIWVPVPADAPRTRYHVELLVAAEREKDVELRAGPVRSTVQVAAEPRWVVIDVEGPPFDVINNAGSMMHEGGYGADRGFWERDEGQYETTAEVFAWCGAAVLLSGRYLDDVGVFDDEYFGYYEDFDLSWRGRSRGWRYLYVPGSRVRHRHAASHVEGSPLFEYFVQRNRLLTLVKNAPAGFAARQCLAYVEEMAQVTYGEVLSPMLQRLPVRPRVSPRRLRSGAGFVRHLPRALRQRRSIDARRTVPADQMLRWAEPLPA